MNIRFKSWLIIVGTLGIGVLIGTLSTTLVLKKAYSYSANGHGFEGRQHGQRGPNPQKILNRMTRQLNLNEAQQKEIEPILAEAFQKIHLIINTSRDSVFSLMQEQREKIIPLLNEEQAGKLDEFFKSMPHRRGMRHFFKHPPGGDSERFGP